MAKMATKAKPGRAKKHVGIDVRQDLYDLAGADPQALSERMQESFVLDLVRRHEISIGRGAELLDMYIGDFIELMAEHGVPYFTEPPRDPEEVEQLLAKAKE